MKIERVIIKDIEIVLADEETTECTGCGNCSCECDKGNCDCKKEEYGKPSKGEESLVSSLSSMVEVFSETITEFLKDELNSKKKDKNITEVFRASDVKEEEIKEPEIFEEVKEEPPIQEPEIEEVKPPKEEFKEVPKNDRIGGIKSNTSNELNDFINKILNSMPDK